MLRYYYKSKISIKLMHSSKYSFEDFTEKYYKKLIINTKKNYSFESFTTRTKSSHVLWRHDIDFSVHRAAKLAKIESDLGVKSTFFFKLHSEFYNLFEKEVLCKAQEIVELGHDVGLHFEYHFYNDSKKFQKNMIWEKKILVSNNR